MCKGVKTICSDSGICIAFGTETDKIKSFFGSFITSEYVAPPMTRIGQVSLNGFIFEFTYKREGYQANAILKSTIDQTSDNLLYEYLVGQYINQLNKVYSCFLETYGLFQYNTNADWEFVKQTPILRENIFKSRLTYVPTPTIAQGCKKAKYLAILLQYIKNAPTLNQIMEQTFHNKEVNQKYPIFTYEILYILFQIYMPLSHVADDFTHYDLHTNNVLIYEPVKGKYIQYYYHPIDAENYTVTTFKSRYIAKIIDYGRSYFKSPQTNSLDIYNTLCATPECNVPFTPPIDCGKQFGFQYLSPERKEGVRHYITSQQPNISHDLRLLYLIYKSNYPLIPELKVALENVNFGKDSRFGTREVSVFNADQINNIHDAYDVLDQIIRMDKWRNINEMIYSRLQKLGDLHIYEDGRPMEFVSVM